MTDITKDSETDATIRLPIRNMVNMSYTDYNNTAINGYTYNPWQWCHFQGGIRKTGAGTLCLNGAISYTHTTEVAGGALLVDSSIATSSGVTVDSGVWARVYAEKDEFYNPVPIFTIAAYKPL